jgi:PII-like signaling protein
MGGGMTGTLLRFYVHENRKHHHILLYEWLLEHAKRTGIPGGSAFRAIAAFGRHGVLHEEHFFEMAGDMTIQIDFAVTDEQAEQLLLSLRDENIDLFYMRIPIEYGVIKATD